MGLRVIFGVAVLLNVCVIITLIFISQSSKKVTPQVSQTENKNPVIDSNSETAIAIDLNSLPDTDSSIK